MTEPMFWEHYSCFEENGLTGQEGKQGEKFRGSGQIGAGDDGVVGQEENKGDSEMWPDLSSISE